MDKENLLPSLRFSGYNDVWEQRKVSELLEERNEQSIKSSDYPLMAFIANKGVAHKGDRYDRSALVNDTENKLYKRTELGDFIYSSNNLETGSIGLNNYGNAVISPVYSIFKPTEIAYSDFIGRRLVRNDFINSMIKWRQGVVYGQWRIHEIDFLQIEVAVPFIEEQRRIGDYFRNLDNLITLHQKEYGKLLILKKAMLVKMFPKNGNDVPEIRFSEFDGAWEYRKLGTISDKITEKNEYMEYTETLTNSAEYGIISQRDFFDHDIAKQDKINGYYVVHPEDFVYNPRISTTAPVGPIGRNKLGRCGVISPLYTVFRPKEVDNSFLEQYFKSSHWYSFMRFNGDTGARSDRFSIKDATFFEMPIPFPKLDEQRRIGQYLAGLDVLISLQDKKLTKLKNIKAGCLEKMFV